MAIPKGSLPTGCTCPDPPLLMDTPPSNLLLTGCDAVDTPSPNLSHGGLGALPPQYK